MSNGGGFGGLGHEWNEAQRSEENEHQQELKPKKKNVASALREKHWAGVQVLSFSSGRSE